MKKKTYEQPKMQVVKLEQADIICTSTQAGFQSYTEDDSTFGGSWRDR